MRTDDSCAQPGGLLPEPCQAHLAGILCTPAAVPTRRCLREPIVHAAGRGKFQPSDANRCLSCMSGTFQSLPDKLREILNNIILNLYKLISSSSCTFCSCKKQPKFPGLRP
jgi:hypothetical protein